MAEKVKYNSFKDRYNNEDGYRERFLKKYNGVKKCICGIEVTGLNLSRHMKGKKHAQIMNIINSLKPQTVV